MKKFLAFGLALSLVFGSIGTISLAETSSETVFNKDNITREIASGTDGYTFMSVYQPCYEMSNHMVSANGGVNNSIPQTLILVEADEDYLWSPDGKYSFGQSNYEILYCCDEETGYNGGVYYKRLNLEDSQYFDVEEAAHIRSIVSNSYPFISLDEMKSNLAAEGFEGAADLTRAEVISAVQMAIWSFANDATELAYSKTFDVPFNTQWGTVLHDFTNEMDVWWTQGKRKFSTNEDVRNRINSLADYLKSQPATYPEDPQIIISDLEIVDAAPVQEKNGVYKTAFHVALNSSGSSEQDKISLSIFVNDENVATLPMEFGTDAYDFIVEAENGDTIKAVVSGTQVLPLGAYFYEPQGGRGTSQCLVGVAGGNTEIYSSAEEKLEVEAPVYADLTLQNTNKVGKVLKGAKFTLTTVTDASEILYDTYEVGESGQFTISRLLPGSYKLEEISVPEGCMVPEAPIMFTVNKDGILTLTESNYAELDEDSIITVVNEEPIVNEESETEEDIIDKPIEENESVIEEELIVGDESVVEDQSPEIELLLDESIINEDVDEDEVVANEELEVEEDIIDKLLDEDECFIEDEFIEEDEDYLDDEVVDEDECFFEDEPAVAEDNSEKEESSTDNTTDQDEAIDEDDSTGEDDSVSNEDSEKDENITDESKEKAPETGDNAPIMMLLLITAISLASVVTLLYKRK